MSGLDFHVKVIRGNNTASVKQYKLCGCVTCEDMIKTITADFDLGDYWLWDFDFNAQSWHSGMILEQVLPYRGGRITVSK